MYEVYDTRTGKRYCHCGTLNDAIRVCEMGDGFRAYREYPLPAVEPLTIDVVNTHKPQIMPAQQRLDPSDPEPLLIKANEQEPLNLDWFR